MHSDDATEYSVSCRTGRMNIFEFRQEDFMVVIFDTSFSGIQIFFSSLGKLREIIVNNHHNGFTVYRRPDYVMPLFFQPQQAFQLSIYARLSRTLGLEIGGSYKAFWCNARESWHRQLRGRSWHPADDDPEGI